MNLPGLSLLSGLAGGWQKIALYAGVVALIYGSGVATGVAIGARHETKSAHVQVVQAKKEGAAQVKALVKQATEQQVQRVEVKVRDIDRETTLIKQLDALQSDRDSLKAQLDAKPDPDLLVHIRSGDVRLLDDAATGNCAPAGVSDPACVAAHQEQAASDVSLRAYVRDGITVRTQYRELADRHDALVDWVQRELIDPQLAGAKALASPASTK